MLWQARKQLVFARNPLDSSGSNTPAAAFLARTSGLDATHTTAYTDLINGLVSDGVWTKLDVLHVYATQDSTTALLNLVSSSYNGTSHGSPTFTADRGFTGVQFSTTVWIDIGFNGNTAVSPKYLLNDAHISAWHVTSTNTDFGYGSVGAGDGTLPFNGTSQAWVLGGTQYSFCNNQNWGQALQGGSAASGAGHWISNRIASPNAQNYHNGASVLGSGTSNGIPNFDMYSLGTNQSGTARGAGVQLAMVSVGGNLTSTETSNFYSRLRTYMTAVGVP